MQWTIGGLDEFETEEVDETWMVHLDAVSSIPGSCLELTWLPEPSRPIGSGDPSLPPPSYFPLRC